MSAEDNARATCADALDGAEAEYLWKRRSLIVHETSLSTIYHRRRERFFALLDRWDKVATLTLGAYAFVSVMGQSGRAWLGIPFGLLAACSLVFGFSDRAREHAQLATEFTALEADIEAKGERDFTEEDINSWAARKRRIELKEPATYVMVARLCANEMARAKGRYQDVTSVGWWHAISAHFFIHGSAEIKSNSSTAS